MNDGLFEGAPMAKTRRQKKPIEPETDTPTVRLETAFVTRHQATWNCQPFRRSIARERKILKDMAAQLGEAEVLTLIDQFFADRHRRGAYTIVDFEAQAAALRIEHQRRPLDPRTAANMDAAARATGRKP